MFKFESLVCWQHLVDHKMEEELHDSSLVASTFRIMNLWWILLSIIIFFKTIETYIDVWVIGPRSADFCGYMGAQAPTPFWKEGSIPIETADITGIHHSVWVCFEDEVCDIFKIIVDLVRTKFPLTKVNKKEIGHLQHDTGKVINLDWGTLIFWTM